jgi:aminotransferase EvaB
MTSAPIPSWSYQYDLLQHRDDYLKAINKVFDSGRLLFGPELLAFEQEFAKFIAVPYSVGCDNATNALFLALKCLNIGQGDEVITVPNTAIPTVSAICQAGAKPVFCDVNQYALIDSSLIPDLITDRTRAIIPVHLYGRSCDMDAIGRIASAYQLQVIEDCSQSHGSTYHDKFTGSFGDLSCFSFYPTKSLGGFGDAGMILAQSKDNFESLRKLRFYGISSDYVADVHGFNSRMDEIHAAILRLKLKRLVENIQYRAKVLDVYTSVFTSSSITQIPVPPCSTSSNYLLPFIYAGNRDALVDEIGRRGVSVNVSYRTPIHLMPAYQYLGHQIDSFPASEYYAAHVFSPPLFDYIPQDLVLQAAQVINEAAEDLA